MQLHQTSWGKMQADTKKYRNITLQTIGIKGSDEISRHFKQREVPKRRLQKN
jgi:hypothetical protein